MYGFWGGRFERHLLIGGYLIPVPNQIAMAHYHLYIASMSKRLEENTIREIEHETFTPLVLSKTGGMGRALYTGDSHQC